jgi:hypothetical protein
MAYLEAEEENGLLACHVGDEALVQEGLMYDCMIV